MKKIISIMMAIMMVVGMTLCVAAEAPVEHDHGCCPTHVTEIEEGDADAEPYILCLTHPVTRSFSTSELEHISGDRYWCIHYTVTICSRCNKTLSKVEYDRHEV